MLLQVVTLTFSVFTTEYGYDYVSLYDGYDASALLIVQLNGRYSDLPSYYSTQMYMFVNFRTDSSVTRYGFIASYQSTYGKQNITALSVRFSDALIYHLRKHEIREMIAHIP